VDQTKSNGRNGTILDWTGSNETK